MTDPDPDLSSDRVEYVIDAARYAAEMANSVARQVEGGYRPDPNGDQVERCIHYYAKSLGINPETIRAAREMT